MTSPDQHEWHRLFNAALNDELDDSGKAEFASLLKSSAEARQLWFLYNDNECALAELKRPLAVPGEPTRISQISWHPLAAAAAGIVFGTLCTAAAFSYIAPGLSKPLLLLDAGFEDLKAPQPTGVPNKPSQWGGDFAEIVEAQQGVTPRGGARMWRFLRADNALRTEAEASYVGEAIHIIDLKALPASGLKEGSQIEISAWFAKGVTAPEELCHWNLKAAAFEGSISQAPELWGKWNQASTSLAQRELSARNEPGHWQQLSMTMLLPENTDFLVFECAVVQRKPMISSGVASYSAYYVDDVRVRLLPPTPDTQPTE